MKKVKLFEQYITEGKDVFPNEIVGNDQILFKKEWEKMNGGKLAAKYNQYYRGYDIDAGGHIFGSVDELERFMKNYILSNNLYNKYKYMPEIPIKESVVNEEFDVSKIKAKDTIELTNTRTGDVGKYTVKRIFGGSSDIKEIEVLTRNKQLLTLYYSKERGLQNFKGDVYESVVHESTNVKDYFKDPMNLADAKGWVRNLKLSDDEIKTKIKSVMKDPSKFNDLMDAMTDELNLKWK